LITYFYRILLALLESHAVSSSGDRFFLLLRALLHDS